MARSRHAIFGADERHRPDPRVIALEAIEAALRVEIIDRDGAVGMSGDDAIVAHRKRRRRTIFQRDGAFRLT